MKNECLDRSKYKQFIPYISLSVAVAETARSSGRTTKKHIVPFQLRIHLFDSSASNFDIYLTFGPVSALFVFFFPSQIVLFKTKDVAALWCFIKDNLWHTYWSSVTAVNIWYSSDSGQKTWKNFRTFMPAHLVINNSLMEN